MHNTHLGSHAPPRFNQLLMAMPEKDFLHSKKVVAKNGMVKMLQVQEKGFGRGAYTHEFQKYCGKKGAQPYEPYRKMFPLVDLKKDKFLSSLGPVKVKSFEKAWSEKAWSRAWSRGLNSSVWIPDEELIQNRIGGKNCEEDFCYMIFQDNGNKKVGLYQDYESDVFKSIHNEGLKGVWFKDLAAAKPAMKKVCASGGHKKFQCSGRQGRSF